ncbi:MAG: hypothetical protein IJ280_06315 [Bacteroidales bacterium]|nr:hypothetical protein [Bacteroidales bacterium]
MSFLFPILKQPRARQFNHQPIYYDKQKEEREQRYERIRKEMNMQAENEDKNVRQDFEKDIRGSFRKNVPGGTKIDQARKISNIVSIVCVVLLIALLIAYALIS